MKKILLLLISLLVVPVTVNATVTRTTTVGNFPAETGSTECYNAESQNDVPVGSKIPDATSGYYLYCIKAVCTSDKVTHEITHPLTSSGITCANGNTDPYIQSDQDTTLTGAPLNGGIGVGDSCTDTTGNALAYATAIVNYDCTLKSNRTVYNATGETTTSSSAKTGTDANSTTNANTGVENYYFVLGGAIVVISLVLYILNKKNVFKKI